MFVFILCLGMGGVVNFSKIHKVPLVAFYWSLIKCPCDVAGSVILKMSCQVINQFNITCIVLTFGTESHRYHLQLALQQGWIKTPMIFISGNFLQWDRPAINGTSLLVSYSMLFLLVRVFTCSTK